MVWQLRLFGVIVDADVRLLFRVEGGIELVVDVFEGGGGDDS